MELKGQILAAPLNFKEGSLNTEEVFSNYTPPFYWNNASNLFMAIIECVCYVMCNVHDGHT